MLLGLFDRLVKVPNGLVHRNLGGLGRRRQIDQGDVALVAVIIVRDPAAACQAHACPPFLTPRPIPMEKSKQKIGWLTVVSKLGPPWEGGKAPSPATAPGGLYLSLLPVRPLLAARSGSLSLRIAFRLASLPGSTFYLGISAYVPTPLAPPIRRRPADSRFFYSARIWRRARRARPRWLIRSFSSASSSAIVRSHPMGSKIGS